MSTDLKPCKMTRRWWLLWIPPPATPLPAVSTWIFAIFDCLATRAPWLSTFHTCSTFSGLFRRQALRQGISDTLSSQLFDGLSGCESLGAWVWSQGLVLLGGRMGYLGNNRWQHWWGRGQLGTVVALTLLTGVAGVASVRQLLINETLFNNVWHRGPERDWRGTRRTQWVMDDVGQWFPDSWWLRKCFFYVRWLLPLSVVDFKLVIKLKI